MLYEVITDTPAVEDVDPVLCFFLRQSLVPEGGIDLLRHSYPAGARPVNEEHLVGQGSPRDLQGAVNAGQGYRACFV